jgi:hypothetical protein
MTAVVFVGPTLSAAQTRAVLPGAQVLGPAARGDVYRAAKAGAARIVLIDGYFDQKLPVWHKELLWALTRGATVYGAASMGALRAAELHRFGMIGVGRIFDWYVSGVIEADDEVAIAHEPPERAYRAVSEALVNLRATFLAAEARGVIHPETRARLIELGRSLFYPIRTLRQLLSTARQSGIDAGELDSLSDWLAASPDNFVDQKRRDALACLERVQLDSIHPPEATTQGVTFSFAYTEVWHELTRQVAAGTSAAVGESPPSPKEAPARAPSTAQRDELTERVMALLTTRDESLARAIYDEAETRAALLEYAALASLQADAAAVQGHSDELRRQRNLLSPENTKLWLSERGLDIAQFSEWMQEEMLIVAARQHAAGGIPQQLKRVIHASMHPAVLRAISEVARRNSTTNQQCEMSPE